MTASQDPVDLPSTAADKPNGSSSSSSGSVATPQSPALAPPNDSGLTSNADDSAIARDYHDLHETCGRILEESSQGDFARLLAESHVFLHELERWTQVLVPRKENHLLAVAAREYQLALLALAQGLYRQAFKGLRLVLELCLQAVHLSAYQVELHEWLECRKDTVWNVLIDEQDGVLSVRFARAFFPELENDVRHYRSLAERLYRECSECVHGSMQKHITLPESLTFSSESFRLWHDKAANVAFVLAFALSLRYLKELQAEDIRTLEHDMLDRLGHVAPIRAFFGGPEGG